MLLMEVVTLCCYLSWCSSLYYGKEQSFNLVRMTLGKWF